MFVLVGQEDAGTAEHDSDDEQAEDDTSAEPLAGVRFLQKYFLIKLLLS